MLDIKDNNGLNFDSYKQLFLLSSVHTHTHTQPALPPLRHTYTKLMQLAGLKILTLNMHMFCWPPGSDEFGCKNNSACVKSLRKLALARSLCDLRRKFPEKFLTLVDSFKSCCCNNVRFGVHIHQYSDLNAQLKASIY